MKTVRAGSSTTVETEVKRSRFISTLARTNTEDEAREVIRQARETYPDARHHCSAFVVRTDGQNPLWHSSDDGEPAGTAGRPMLDVLVHAGLENVTAVVTRYFGGTLLGTGGLVRAYGGAVNEAISASPLVSVEELGRFRTHLDPAAGGRVEAQLRAAGWNVVAATWTNGLDLDIAAPPEKLADLNAELSALLQEEATFHQVGTVTTELDYSPRGT